MAKTSQILDVDDLEFHLKKVDQQLIKAVSADLALGASLTPLIKAGGKRIRPSLLIACSSISKGKINEDVIKLAAVVELVHIGSLVHDDIIDEAALRRQLPTINSQDINLAILAGDYMLAMACALAAEVNQQAARLTALTIVELCAGQNLELRDKNKLTRTKDDYFNTINGKTASLIRLSCVLGGLIAGLSDQQINSLRDFGDNFGAAFQLIDDLMDLISTEKLYGKPVNNDIAEGIFTLPVILCLQTNQADQFKKLLKSNTQSNEIVKFLFESGSINNVLDITHQYCQQASNSILSMNGPAARALRDLPENYLNLCLEKYISPQHRQMILRPAVNSKI